ncbi:MAG: MJ0042-type zinc finger domain-containing protein, partial [Gammaproteobacteria bacterium]
MAALMSQAITRCPECQTSFLITEDQLLAANGKVRCGACMHVFQAEDYFVSPMLDVTELLAIEHDYWANFEQYVEQV